MASESPSSSKNKTLAPVLEKESTATGVDFLERPKRPLSAYNLFFRDEREKLMQVLPSQGSAAPRSRGNRNINKAPHHKISFANLGKTISARWKALHAAAKQPYEDQASAGRAEYHKKAAAWREQRIQLGLPYKRKHNRRKTTAVMKNKNYKTKANKPVMTITVPVVTRAGMGDDLEPLPLEEMPDSSKEEEEEDQQPYNEDLSSGRPCLARRVSSASFETPVHLWLPAAAPPRIAMASTMPPPPRAFNDNNNPWMSAMGTMTENNQGVVTPLNYYYSHACPPTTTTTTMTMNTPSARQESVLSLQSISNYLESQQQEEEIPPCPMDGLMDDIEEATRPLEGFFISSCEGDLLA